MDNRQLTALAVFAAGYVLISTRRLPLLPVGRPAGALIGAVLTMAFCFRDPEAAFRHVNFSTLALLLGTMLLSVHLAEAGFFAWAADRLIRSAGSARGLLRTLVFGSGLLSAFLVNDTVCVMVTPLLVAVLVRTGLPFLPFLLALATSSNIGSSMTLTGNPQNVIIGIESKIPYLSFLAQSAPGALAGLWLNYRLLLRMYGPLLADGPLPPPAEPPRAVDRRLLIKSLAAGGLMVVGFCALPSQYLSWSALAGAGLLLILMRRDAQAAFAGVDWPLLVFFAGLFVMVGGLVESGLTVRAYDAVAGWFTPDPGGWAAFTAFSLVGSNLFSNVPFVMVVGQWMNAFADPQFAWLTLALTSTLAGNLTLVGSVANIIVVESARGHYSVGFWEYLRFGLPTTLLTTAVGMACLAGMHALFR